MKNYDRGLLLISVTVTVVRDRKIRTALRTNQIVGFVTVPAWKKIIPVIYVQVKYLCDFVVFKIAWELFDSCNCLYTLFSSLKSFEV